MNIEGCDKRNLLENIEYYIQGIGVCFNGLNMGYYIHECSYMSDIIKYFKRKYKEELYFEEVIYMLGFITGIIDITYVYINKKEIIKKI